MSNKLNLQLTLVLTGGQSVHADLSMPKSDQPSAVVVFLHGYKGFKDWGCWNGMAQRFTESGLALLKFNFSGNGTTADAPLDFKDLVSFAENTYSRELDEAVGVVECIYRGELATHGLKGGLPIYVLGHSRGGGIAILAAARTPNIERVATWSAVSDFGKRFPTGEALEKWRKSGVMYVANARTKQELPHNYSWYTDYITNEEHLDIRAAARKMTQPLLVVHAADDEAVRVEEARTLFSVSSRVSLIVLHEGGHTLGASHPWEAEILPEPMGEAIDQTISFFTA